MTQRIPDGYRGATPYLCIKGAARALDFYKQAFGATEAMRMPQHDGSIAPRRDPHRRRAGEI